MQGARLSTLNITSQKLYSGDTWVLRESLSEYPATEYTLSVLIKFRTNSTITLQFAADGLDHTLTAGPSVTDIPSGDYNYQAKVSGNGVTKTIAEGIISILANLSSGQDPREYWTARAEDLKDIYAKLSRREVTETTYNGRVFKYRDTRILLQEIEYAENMAGLNQPLIIRERC